MTDINSKRCKALLDAARGDEPNADALNKTAAALGIPAAIVATTLSTGASAAVQTSTAKAAGLATSKLAAAAKGSSGLSAMTLGATSATAKLVSVAVLAVGGAVGITQVRTRLESPQQVEPRAVAVGGERTTPSNPALLNTAPVDTAPVNTAPVDAAPVNTAESGESPAASGTTTVFGGFPAENPMPRVEEAVSSAPEATSTRRNTSVRRTETAAHSQNASPKRAVASATSRDDGASGLLEREMVLLSKARAVAASNPTEALRWLDEYQHQFPSGLLKHEASVLRARANDANLARHRGSL